MVNLVVNASKVARKARKKLSGFSAVISRKVNGIWIEGDATVVTFGETIVDELVASETVISTRLRDLLIDACDYRIPGISEDPIEPEECDRITVTLNSGSTVFEVIPRADARHFRRSDRYGLTWRVHTKEI